MSDLEGTDFSGASGLKPVYFFLSYNHDKAIFDDPDFTQKIEAVTLDHFCNEFEASELFKDMADFLNDIVQCPVVY